jgi:hypothetical protein
VTLPQDAELYATPEEIPMPENWDDWFAWQADSNATVPSSIDMSTWLEAPAGKHGRVSSDGHKLVYNGESIRFWGLNNTYASCAPPRELAERRAEFYAKYGINSVRLHKLAHGPRWAGIQSLESAVEFDPESLDQLDYYIAKLKEKGIYVKFSVALGWGMRLGRKDKKYVPYIDEFGEFGDSPAARVNPGHGAIYWSPEVQTAKILQLTNLLEHENPYTGMTYAEDPAIFLVEMTNEESIYWYTTMRTMLQRPHLREYAATEFSKWLRKKYGNEERLLEAWGENALNAYAQDEGVTGERLEDNSIVPVGNIWFFDPANLDTSQLERKPRLLDTMQFMYEMQNRFYDRFMQAIRDAGYEGMVESSNWQAGRAMSHYLNLHSDARIGLIDRHNYYGNRPSMLRVPGSGTLSSGLQQVAHRPFSISEWIHTYPNDRGVEGPAIIGAYGMGLQGWDISFMFQNNDEGRFSSRVGRQRWDVVAPQVMGVFPAVARQVLRGDVQTAREKAELKVHLPSLARGEIDFTDMVEQQHDIKVLNTDKVPAKTLAVARTVVTYTEEAESTENFPITEHTENGTLVSTTGQLRWTPMGARPDYDGEGFFTMDTAGTQALVGYAQGRTADLGQVTITSQSPFSAIYVSAADQNAGLADGRRWLVTTMARARNEGMVYHGRTLLRRGNPPILMEPVKATLKLKRQGATVHVLDHDGRRTGQTVPVQDGTVVLDGAETQAVYYEIDFE